MFQHPFVWYREWNLRSAQFDSIIWYELIKGTTFINDTQKLKSSLKFNCICYHKGALISNIINRTTFWATVPMPKEFVTSPTDIFFSKRVRFLVRYAFKFRKDWSKIFTVVFLLVLMNTLVIFIFQVVYNYIFQSWGIMLPVLFLENSFGNVDGLYKRV